MPAPDQARRALKVVTTAAVATATALIDSGAPDRTRGALLEATPAIIGYYSDGSAALAADHYDDLREEAAPRSRYTATPIVDLRERQIETGVLWATEPLYRAEPDQVLAIARLAEIVQLETARPFRSTVTINTRRDPAAVGWRRISGGGCNFCQMLAGRGAVYRSDTARFASHPNCDCSAAPVFDGNAGPEASAMQYIASQRRRTPAQQRALREHLAAMP